MFSVRRAKYQRAAKVKAGTSEYLDESDTKEVNFNSQVAEVNANPHFSLQKDNSEYDFDLALCLAIKSHPNIYNHGFNRRKIEASDTDWIMISEELNTPVAECKVRYTKLREWYVKQKHRGKSGPIMCRNQNQFDALTFLDPYIFPRNRKRNSKKNSQNVTQISQSSSTQDTSENLCPNTEVEMLDHSNASKASFEDFDDMYNVHEHDNAAERVFSDVTNTLTLTSSRINSDMQNQTKDNKTANEEDMIYNLGKVILLRLNEMDDKSAKRCRNKIQRLLIEYLSDDSDA